MNKKFLIVIVILVLILIFAFSSLISANQDFDGKFTMNVPLGKHYSNVAWCLPNGGLGCEGEYREDNADCDIEEGDIVIYYYNNSLLVEGESNALEHALNGLTTSYFYQFDSRDGELYILTNDIGMKALPPFLVGKSNHDGSEVVFVGGNNLNDVKHFATTIEFLN